MNFVILLNFYWKIIMFFYCVYCIGDFFMMWLCFVIIFWCVELIWALFFCSFWVLVLATAWIRTIPMKIIIKNSTELMKDNKKKVIWISSKLILQNCFNYNKMEQMLKWQILRIGTKLNSIVILSFYLAYFIVRSEDKPLTSSKRPLKSTKVG